MYKRQAYHRNIYQALAQKDAQRAENEMEAHLIDIDKRLNHMMLVDELKNRS